MENSNVKSGTRKWIVVIDKLPRGPLNHEDVLTLVERGVLSENDLILESSAEQKRADWKFLYQVPEFKAALEIGREAVVGKQEPKELESEEPVAEESKPIKASDALPPELSNLPMEDLLPKVVKKLPFETVEVIEEVQTDDNSGSMRYIALGATAFVVFLVFLVVKTQRQTEQKPVAKKPAEQSITNKVFDVTSKQTPPPVVKREVEPVKREVAPTRIVEKENKVEKHQKENEDEILNEQRAVGVRRIFEDEEDEFDDEPVRRKSRSKKSKRRMPASEDDEAESEYLDESEEIRRLENEDELVD